MSRAYFPDGCRWVLVAVVATLLSGTLSVAGAATPGLAGAASASVAYDGMRHAEVPVRRDSARGTSRDARQRTPHKKQLKKCLRRAKANKKRLKRVRAVQACQRRAAAAKPKARPALPAVTPKPRANGLPWAAPSLNAGHVTVRVTNSPATRRISLKAGQDALIVLPNQPLTDYSPVGIGDAMVTVTGGRNVIVLGGHIRIQRPPVTHLTAAVGADAMTLTVGSTAGYPPSGILRVDGEGIVYSSRDATHFYVKERRKGYYNTSPVSSREAHDVGAPVYVGEGARSGMSFQKQTGIVHVEGLLIDGFVNDGLRFSGGRAVAQVQRTRIGPNTNYDLAHQTDGHPDGIQAYGGGAKEIRLARTTILVGPNGNGLLNKGSDSGDGSRVVAWRLRSVEVVSRDGRARSLVANSDTSSIWDVSGASVRYPSGFAKTVSASIASRFTNITYEAGQSDIAPLNTVGIAYR